jgi:hypothetical protein
VTPCPCPLPRRAGVPVWHQRLLPHPPRCCQPGPLQRCSRRGGHRPGPGGSSASSAGKRGAICAPHTSRTCTRSSSSRRCGWYSSSRISRRRCSRCWRSHSSAYKQWCRSCISGACPSSSSSRWRGRRAGGRAAGVTAAGAAGAAGQRHLADHQPGPQGHHCGWCPGETLPGTWLVSAHASMCPTAQPAHVSAIALP